jgi:hypothetical protein
MKTLKYVAMSIRTIFGRLENNTPRFCKVPTPSEGYGFTIRRGWSMIYLTLQYGRMAYAMRVQLDEWTIGTFFNTFKKLPKRF